jgi:hypothetical protein
MKKTISLLVLFLLPLIFVKPAFAIVDLEQAPKNIQLSPQNTGTTKLQIANPNIKPLSTAKPSKKQFNYENINQHQNKIKQGLQARYAYLYNISIQLQERIAARADAGEDMTKANNKLEEINQYLKDYLEDINNFENKIGEILTSETPGKIMPELRIAVKAVRTDLNAMRKILSDTVKLLITKEE